MLHRESHPLLRTLDAAWPGTQIARRLATAPDDDDNVLARAFGVTVALIMLWSMNNLNERMIPMDMRQDGAEAGTQVAGTVRLSRPG
ncbi:MAG TPA: hypothetical protein VE397_18290 [Stellaceae bacterium]|nr:hypothetical protein [Stellaceae bacterium]